MDASTLILAVAIQVAAQAAPPPDLPAEPVGYETRTAQGQQFRVGKTSRHEVWLAWGAAPRLELKGGMGAALVVVVGNASGEALPFDPAAVRVWERSGGKDRPLKTLAVEEVERKRRNLKTLRASVRNREVDRAYAPPVSSVLGANSDSTRVDRFNDGVPVELGRNARGPRFPVEAPTLRDGKRPDNAASDRVAPMGSGAPATLWAMRSTLMRPGIVEPKTYFGGLIYIDPARFVPLRVEVQVGTDEFWFDLEP